MKQVWTLVLTGGPCSGKTTGLATIEQELTNRGYYILIIPETATELISTGIRPFGNSLEVLPFQYLVFEKQLHKEELYRKVATMLSADKIVIIHDRGIIDNKSYVDNHQVEEAKKLDELSISNWTGHPHFRIIDNSTNFEDKIARLMNEVFAVLGEPIPRSY